MNMNMHYFNRYHDLFKEKQLDLWRTETLEYIDGGLIAYKIVTGNQHIFTYFQCFRPNVWLLILFSVLIMSIVLTLIQKRYNEFFKNLWFLFISLISESNAKNILLNNINKSLIGF